MFVLGRAHRHPRARDLPLAPSALEYPFFYSDEDRFALRHCLAPNYHDPAELLTQWARQFVRADAPTGTRELLVAMTEWIRNSMRYIARFDEGVQTPSETLRMQSGTCRDFATLIIEAVRRLGYAARFVSGYLYTPWLDNNDGTAVVGTGATHAWVQVFLPCAGWIPFDPTNNLIGGTDLVRVGVVHHASQASPVSGSWHGYAGNFAGMHVDVQVRRR